MGAITDDAPNETIPLRTRTDTLRLAAVTAVLSVTAVAIGVVTLPYDVTRPSPILEKAEVRESIRQFRLKNGHWPLSAADPGFSFGPRAFSDAGRPEFQWIRTAFERPTKNEPPVEAAYYTVTVRGDVHTHRISLEKPKKRR